MNKLKIAYFGSPDFSASILEKLIQNSEELGITVAVVFTQPDRPVGRKGILTPTPVKLIAEKYGIDVVTSTVIARRNDEAIPSNPDQMSTGNGIASPATSSGFAMTNIDLAILYAYAQIIREDLLNAPKYGFWNIHPSLLPAYRGASPTAFPLMIGEQETGVSLMKMDTMLDHGPLLAQKSYRVSPTDTKISLEKKLTELSFELLSEKLKATGYRLQAVNQDQKLATFTRKLTKNDGYISTKFISKALQNAPIIPEELPKPLYEFRSQNSTLLPQEKRPAGEILYDLWRALYDWPGVWTKVMINGVEKRLKLTEMAYSSPSSTNSLQILKVQLEGKNEVDFKTFTSAYEIFD